jgi:hypothetical protein
MRHLLDEWRAGRMEPERVPHRSAPAGLRPEDYLIFADLVLRTGLQLAVGEPRPVPYATSEAVRAGYVAHPIQASRALHRLEREGLIRNVGALPRYRRRDGLVPPFGTRLFRVLPPAAGDQGVNVVVDVPVPDRDAQPVEPHIEVPQQAHVDRAELAAGIAFGMIAPRDGASGAHRFSSGAGGHAPKRGITWLEPQRGGEP